MKTFQTDSRGELVLKNGNPVMVSDAECLRQRLNNRVKLFAEEWFLAPDEGIAWIEILSDKSNAVMIESEIRRAILADEEVDSIESLTVEEDAVSRSLSIKFSVSTKIGKIEGGTKL